MADTKLTLNDDGTVTVPVLDAEDRGKVARQVELREPAAEELAEFLDAIHEADEALAALTGYERQRLQFDPENSPHGLVLVRMLATLGGEEVRLADLPSWACNPDTMVVLRAHFAAPLRGDLAKAALGLASQQGNGNRATRRAEARDRT